MNTNSKNTKTEQCDIHVVMQTKFIKCFKLYKKVKSDLEHYVNMRGGSFGVGIEQDSMFVSI